MKIACINGPNMNMLGVREPHFYGTISLEAIEESIKQLASELQVEVTFFQSNSEADIVNFIHTCYRKIDGLIINPAGFTHSSLPIREALLAVEIPFVELHLSNVALRAKTDEFRRVNFFSDIAVGVIYGFKEDSYLLALRGTKRLLDGSAGTEKGRGK